jgi:hypothetical protein
MAIVKASYQTRSKGSKPVLDSFRYYSYREGADLAQRRWYDRDGRALDFDVAKAEIRERASTYGYTYRIVLSTKDAELGPDEYRQVLAEQFPEYYLVEHRNTEYPHAHVLAFSKTQMKKDELFAMRGRLLEREQARELGQQRVGGMEIDQQSEVPAPAQDRQQDRDRGLDWDDW